MKFPNSPGFPNSPVLRYIPKIFNYNISQDTEFHFTLFRYPLTGHRILYRPFSLPDQQRYTKLFDVPNTRKWKIQHFSIWVTSFVNAPEMYLSYRELHNKNPQKVRQGRKFSEDNRISKTERPENTSQIRPSLILNTVTTFPK